MSASTDATPASNVLGTIGTVFWCIQLVPQIWYNWRRKKTEGLPPAMGFLWAICAVPMGVYLILQEVNLPMQIQPQVFGTFSAIIWAQILHYDQTAVTPPKKPHSRIPYNKGITWPDLLVGAIATVLLAGGMLPIYFELGKRQGRVIGISTWYSCSPGAKARILIDIDWVFLCIDTLGGLFSIFALVTSVVLELGIYLSHIIWRIRFREARKEAKLSGGNVEDVLRMSSPA
ncbi:PQ-loop-domain-containing protein [Aspergillus costaricaensis CBS 115574]|uniref:PQ-loop-domain-containing protein n=1 Tax=Aspergillus costaricaensis CBS 115574 TaxID=1448317 RepID=A0ACD1ICK6_9EURO|nr:PQ-loop-domain-containing protein [Aspergillus costaricaensis CBS 115574]RAK87736.1 PQ-loop-domain-containing protein [Aspergillus costaricaensis CBS 115574]